MTMLSPVDIDHHQQAVYYISSTAAIIDDPELLNILGFTMPVYTIIEDWNNTLREDTTTSPSDNHHKLVPDLIGADDEEYDDLDSIYSSSTHQSFNYTQAQHKKRRASNEQENEDTFAGLEFVDVVFPAAANTSAAADFENRKEYDPLQLTARFVPETSDDDPLFTLNHADFAQKQEEDIRLSMVLSTL